MEIQEMEKVQGRGDPSTATGFMCAGALCLLFAGPFAVLSTPFAVGCAIGGYAMS